jgi:Exostosin family
MATVFLAAADGIHEKDDWWLNLPRLRRSAELAQGPGAHVLASDPGSADLVLFTDSTSPTFADIRNSRLYKAHKEKSFVYSTADRDIQVLPGAYTSSERSWYLPGNMRAAHYAKVMDHDYIVPSPVRTDAPYLGSFVGSFVTHSVRHRLSALSGPRMLIRDTSNDAGRGYGQSPEIYKKWADQYARSLMDSIFVLCPRGVAPSSYRIFEAMRAGRAPVIISDEWVPPMGPDWSRFALFVPEAEVSNLQRLLTLREADAAQMGREARLAWERWFSAEATFQSIVDWCLEIGVARRGSWRPWLQLLRPFHLRHTVRHLVGASG